MGNVSLQLLFLMFFFIVLYFDAIRLGFCNDDRNVSCIKFEKALFEFKTNLSGHSRSLSSWSGEECCRWEGVSCNSKTKHVTSLDLSYPVASGRLSGSLGKLCHLEILLLPGNNIEGDIIDFIDSLSKCTRNSLQVLDLGSNKLTGSVPNTIGNLSSLEELHLYDNPMSGNISKNFGQLSSLVTLDLNDNQLGGVITEAHLMNLSSLKVLRIARGFSPNNSLAFNISPGWDPPFKLRSIFFWSCQVGPRFPEWLKNQTELTSIVLKNAAISGNIPDWFMNLNLQLDELTSADNQLSGEVPNLLRFTPSAVVDLNLNLFGGPFPLWSSDVSRLSLGGNLFSGPIPLDIGTRMPNMKALDISNNLLDGNIPMSLCNMTTLECLVISNNRLSGKIPKTWDKMPFLSTLDMSNNRLFGTLPNSMGSLVHLQVLALSDNNLFGQLPSSLRNCTEMVVLDLGNNQLSGNLPAWVGESMQPLSLLRLRNNSLTGDIPLQLCSLSSLHILDLSKNNLSGSIPPCLEKLIGFNFKSVNDEFWSFWVEWRLQVVTKGDTFVYDAKAIRLLNSIDLSDNNLTGEIPANITTLFGLNTLNLSMNHLTGKIPSDIGNMRQLDSGPFCQPLIRAYSNKHGFFNFHGSLEFVI